MNTLHMRYVLQFFVIIIIVLLLAQWPVTLGGSTMGGQRNGPHDVIRVIDGDTIVVDVDQVDVTVRLIGIDTPEFDENFYRDASDYTRALLAGQSVYLEYDVDHFDKYGRTLAYVYLSDQTTMVNSEVMRAGWADLLIIEPNGLHQVELRRALREAIFSGRGIH